MPSEVQKLLAYVNRFDNRREPDPQTLAQWTKLLAGASFQDAIAAVDEHFASQPGEYLQVGHVIAGVKQIRAERLAEFGDSRLVESIPADPDDGPRWHAQRLALAAMVASGEVTAATPLPELQARVSRLGAVELARLADRAAGPRQLEAGERG